MASVTFSGAGPPLETLYLIPKSPSGPPGLWLADRISALADDHPAEAIGRRHADRRLDHGAVVVAAVAADHQRLPLAPVQHVEHGLDEILGIMRLLEDLDLLAQAGGAGLLIVEGAGRYGDGHGHSSRRNRNGPITNGAGQCCMHRPRACVHRSCHAPVRRTP
jgi:hypothetical protein